MRGLPQEHGEWHCTIKRDCDGRRLRFVGAAILLGRAADCSSWLLGPRGISGISGQTVNVGTTHGRCPRIVCLAARPGGPSRPLQSKPASAACCHPASQPPRGPRSATMRARPRGVLPLPARRATCSHRLVGGGAPRRACAPAAAPTRRRSIPPRRPPPRRYPAPPKGLRPEKKARRKRRWWARGGGRPVAGRRWSG